MEGRRKGLGEGANTPKDRDLSILEKWVDVNKMEFNKENHRILNLGNKNDKHIF